MSTKVDAKQQIMNGGLVLLDSQTASSSAALSFTAISSAYDEYIFELVSVVLASSSSQMLMQVSTNGGSSYDTSSANYDSLDHFKTLGFSAGDQDVTSTSGYFLFSNGSSATGLSGTVRLYDPLSSSAHKFIIKEVVGLASNALNFSIGGGRYKSNTAVNAVKFIPSTGNIASGTIRMYGVAKS